MKCSIYTCSSCDLIGFCPSILVLLMRLRQGYSVVTILMMEIYSFVLHKVHIVPSSSLLCLQNFVSYTSLTFYLSVQSHWNIYSIIKPYTCTYMCYIVVIGALWFCYLCISDGSISLYNTEGSKFSRFKVIDARDVGWSVLSTAFRYCKMIT